MRLKLQQPSNEAYLNYTRVDCNVQGLARPELLVLLVVSLATATAPGNVTCHFVTCLTPPKQSDKHIPKLVNIDQLRHFDHPRSTQELDTSGLDDLENDLVRRFHPNHDTTLPSTSSSSSEPPIRLDLVLSGNEIGSLPTYQIYILLLYAQVDS